MFSYNSPPNYIPIINEPFLYITGLGLSNDATTPRSVLDIATGQCRDSSDAFDMNLGTAITISTATKGAGGLDTGTIAASKVYAVILISDPVSGNATNAMFTLTPSAPVMPYGYSAYRVIGFVTTDSSAFILKGYWTAGGTGHRQFVYDAPISVGTTSTSASYAAIDLTKFAPLINNLPVNLLASISGTAGDTLSLQAGNATGAQVVVTAQVNSQAITENVQVLAQNTTISTVVSPTINYKNSGTDTIVILVVGYVLNI